MNRAAKKRRDYLAHLIERAEYYSRDNSNSDGELILYEGKEVTIGYAKSLLEEMDKWATPRRKVSR